jgi:hypothetical protein
MNSIFISFLRENNIQYYCEKNSVFFPCFQCYQLISVYNSNDNWYCENCHISGNIFTLIELIENMDHNKLKNIRLYNPRKERKLIKASFRHLKKKYKDDKQIQTLEDRVNKLMDVIIEQ